jgi:hypothetical protein
MNSISIELAKARDAENSFGIRPVGNDHWLARTGFGSDLQPVWTVEIQGNLPSDKEAVDWDMVLSRIVEAYRLNDPVITGFDWPSSRNAPQRRDIPVTDLN